MDDNQDKKQEAPKVEHPPFANPPNAEHEQWDRARGNIFAGIERYMQNLKENPSTELRDIQNNLARSILSAIGQMSEDERFQAIVDVLHKVAQADPKRTESFRAELSQALAVELLKAGSEESSSALEHIFKLNEKLPLEQKKAFYDNPWFDTAFTRVIEDLHTYKDPRSKAFACCKLLQEWPSGVQEGYKNTYMQQTMAALEEVALTDPRDAASLATFLRESFQKTGDLTMDAQLRDFIQNNRVRVGLEPVDPNQPGTKGIVIASGLTMAERFQPFVPDPNYGAAANGGSNSRLNEWQQVVKHPVTAADMTRYSDDVVATRDENLSRFFGDKVAAVGVVKGSIAPPDLNADFSANMDSKTRFKSNFELG